MTFKFDKLIRSVTTDQMLASLLGLYYILRTLKAQKCEGHKCSQVDVEKYKLIFCFSRQQYPDVLGDICPCICNHQTAYIAYWRLYLVKKMKQYRLKFHASGQRCGYIDSSGDMWYGSANHSAQHFAMMY